MQCPKCKAVLEPCGRLDVDGHTLNVYQCDDCIIPWRMGNTEFPVALTFAVDSAGRMLNSTTLEPLSLN